MTNATPNESKTTNPPTTADSEASARPVPKPVRTRVRVRFAKRGDLRLISHRDMVRAFERLFRRVGVSLAMSQGFHPRPLMTFPDALSLGVLAEDEVMDITLAESVDPEAFQQLLASSCPPGLEIRNVQLLGDQDRKAKIARVEYVAEFPNETLQNRSLTDLQQAIDELRQRDSLTVTRKEKEVEINLRESLERLLLEGSRLMMSIRILQQSQLQPRDILAAIGLPDVLSEGATLTRTKVELYP